MWEIILTPATVFNTLCQIRSPSPGAPAQEGSFVDQAKPKVCWRKASSLVLVPGGGQPQALPFSPALLAVASECPVSLFFLAGSGMDVEGGTGIRCFFLHMALPCMLVRLAPLAGCIFKFDSWGQGLWFSDIFPAPPGSDRKIKSQVAARLDLFMEFCWPGKNLLKASVTIVAEGRSLASS